MNLYVPEKGDAEALDRIHHYMGSFSETEHKIAEYILQHAADVETMTASNLASSSGVSAASVVRFCKTIGFKGFNELKYYLKNIAPKRYRMEEDITRFDDLQAIKEKFMKINQNVIEETMQMLDLKAMDRAINSIIGAKRILIAGEGGSGSICVSAYNLFLQLGLPCMVETDAFLQIMAATHLEKGDVLLAIIHSGRTINTIDSIRAAKENGATVIGIVGHEKSPLATLSDIVIYSTTRDTLTLSDVPSARISELSIIGVLQLGILSRDYRKYSRKNEKSKKVYKLKRVNY